MERHCGGSSLGAGNRTSSARTQGGGGAARHRDNDGVSKKLIEVAPDPLCSIENGRRFTTKTPAAGELRRGFLVGLEVELRHVRLGEDEWRPKNNRRSSGARRGENGVSTKSRG